MRQTESKATRDVVTAREPDRSLREIIGESVDLAEIFTQDRIAACQKMVDDAKSSFFDTTAADMESLYGLASDKRFANDYQELCRRIFQPVSNIKGQADIFGFRLTSTICRFLIEYCEASSKSVKMSRRDGIIMSKLVEALGSTLKNRITDSDGALEKELQEVVKLAQAN